MKTKGRVQYQLSCSVRAVILASREFKFSGQMGREKKKLEKSGRQSVRSRLVPSPSLHFIKLRPNLEITEGQEEACGIFALCEPATCSHGHALCLNRRHWFNFYRETDYSSYQATLSSRSINHGCEGNYSKCNNMNN